MNGAWCDHEARIYCSANNTTKRIPRALIKPVKKVVKTMLHHVRGGSIVKPETRMNTSRPQYFDIILCYCFASTYQGSNSWIILSNRITANNRDAKPANQASVRTVTVINVLKPAVFWNNPLLGPLTGLPAAVAGIF